MQNKETVNGALHSRPCFFSFQDNNYPDILWCVPISSKLEKYKSIVSKKNNKYISNGKNLPKYNTICFAEVMGMERAFLIQNIFPTTEKYILSNYIDRNTKNPVTLNPRDKKRIIASARYIIKLVLMGKKNLIFTDIVKLREDIREEDLKSHRDIKKSIREKLKELKVMDVTRKENKQPNYQNNTSKYEL